MAVSVNWLAERQDADAHAYPSRGRGNALCGARYFDPRFAYPPMFHCDLCRQKVEEARKAKNRKPSTRPQAA